MAGTLIPNDLIYVNYPRKRIERDKAFDIHNTDWDDDQRKQQGIWRRRQNEKDAKITGDVKRLTKTGPRIDIELTDGTTAKATEYGESSDGFLVGKVDES